MKKVFVCLLLIATTCYLYALTPLSKTVAFENCSVTALYPDKVQPGDAVFIRLIFTTSILTTPSGEVKLVTASDKILKKSSFYTVKKDTSGKAYTTVLLTGIPLSTYTEPGTYRADVSLTINKSDTHSISVPITVSAREFISETIKLNATNTAIKTDTSTTRKNQIDRLNAILDTKDTQAIFQEGPFTPPTPATRRTSFFGDRRIYAYNTGKSSTSLHYGIDYGVPTGTNVAACASGKVVMAENRISTGWSVCIEHLPGLYSLYYHMSKLSVTEGQMVSKGDSLGLSGATGLATGPHLHWEIRLNMEAVSPDFFTNDFAFAQAKY
ncbi:MAG: M23 family metallopeptidase [Treponema sp.]|nr:M23 family metallopeptidase [Treponema sp.]